MAPVFHRLEYDVEEVVGVPTELNRMLIDGQLDIAPISSMSTRAMPIRCGSCPASASRRRVPSTRSSSSRGCRSVACGRSRSRPRARPRSCSRGCCFRRRDPVFEEEADAKLLIGDAALKSAFEDPTPHYDLGRLSLEKTGLPMVFAVGPPPSRSSRGSPTSSTLSSRRCASRAPSPRSSPTRRASATAIRRASWRAFREAPLQLRLPRAGRLLHVPRDGPRRR